MDGSTLVSLVMAAARRIDTTRWRVIVLGGDAPPRDRPPNVVTTYGMTETGSGVVYDGVPLDGVDVMTGPDGFLQEMMFERGELDMVLIPGADFVRITTDPHWKTCVRSLPQNSTDYLALNCRMEPFTDVRVRQALNYAVNKERLIRMANGRGVIAVREIPSRAETAPQLTAACPWIASRVIGR